MNLALFHPNGVISASEFGLIKTAVSLMLVVAIPMVILFYTFARRYRAGKKAKYDPNRTYRAGQLVWWAIPGTIIAIIAVLVWKSTHALDPVKPIEAAAPPLTIQVVALDWKWLFIYPEQDIATVNFVEFPEQTPVHFVLTADAPMNSFWIPELGGQMFAMTGMETQLNLMASTTGEFGGEEVEINGEGFAGMHFMADSVSDNDFAAWVASVKRSSPALTQGAYDTLALPSTYDPAKFYSTVEKNLYNSIIEKYL